MNAEEIKQFLSQAKADPALIVRDADLVDRVLRGVIKLEKKHLYGAGTTSANRRREEIEKFVDKELASIIAGE